MVSGGILVVSGNFFEVVSGIVLVVSVTFVESVAVLSEEPAIFLDELHADVAIIREPAKARLKIIFFIVFIVIYHPNNLIFIWFYFFLFHIVNFLSIILIISVLRNKINVFFMMDL